MRRPGSAARLKIPSSSRNRRAPARVMSSTASKKSSAFNGPASTINHVHAGKLKALALGGDKRATGLENVPTFAEAGYPAVLAAQWYGLVTTAGTPKAIVDKLNRETVRALQMPDIQKQLNSSGFDAAPTTPQQFAQLLMDDVARWQKVVKTTGIRLE